MNEEKPGNVAEMTVVKDENEIRQMIYIVRNQQIIVAGNR